MWTTDLFYKVFTTVKVETTKKMQTKYPNINFTTSSKASTTPKFPTVYVKRMQGAERGQTIDGKTINAVLSTIQVEVITNTRDSEAQEIADFICLIFKSLGYQMLGEPFPDNTGDTYRNVARYQRLVGYNDIF